MRCNLDEIPDPTADIGAAMGVAANDMDSSGLAIAAADKMEAFAQSVGLVQRLKEFNLTEEQLKACAELSMSDGSIIYIPKIVMEGEEVFSIYRMAY